MNYTNQSTHEQTAAKEYPAQQPIYYVNWGTAVVVLAMLSVTITIIFITSRNAESAPYGIVGSVIFFLVGTPTSVLAVNGSVAEMWRAWHEQKTIQQRDTLDARLQILHTKQATALQVVQRQLPYKDDIDPLQTHHGRRFVPAVPDIDGTVKLDAANFVSQLFDPSDGRPLPSKITKNKGQVQHASPSQAAKEYLMSLGIVNSPYGTQLYWNMAGFPTHRDALNAIRTGVRPFSYEQGVGAGIGGSDE